MAFLDADEIQVLNRHDSIQALLERYDSDTGAIGINWLMFGSGGETAYRNELQAVRFLNCSPLNTIKSIARMRSARPPTGRVTPFAHCVDLSDGTRYYDDKGEPLEFSDITKTVGVSYEVTLLNHYVLGSLGEFQEKVARGAATRLHGSPQLRRHEAFWLANERGKVVREQSGRIDRWVAKAAGERARLAAAVSSAVSSAGMDPFHGCAVALTLAPGSLLVMRGSTQRRYRHALPRTRKPVGPRVNLTFRRVAR